MLVTPIHLNTTGSPQCNAKMSGACISTSTTESSILCRSTYTAGTGKPFTRACCRSFANTTATRRNGPECFERFLLLRADAPGRSDCRGPRRDLPRGWLLADNILIYDEGYRFPYQRSVDWVFYNRSGWPAPVPTGRKVPAGHLTTLYPLFDRIYADDLDKYARAPGTSSSTTKTSCIGPTRSGQQPALNSYIKSKSEKRPSTVRSVVIRTDLKPCGGRPHSGKPRCLGRDWISRATNCSPTPLAA